MNTFDVYDNETHIGVVTAEDKKTAKKKFFEENHKIDADRKAQHRVKCSYKLKRRK